MPPTATPAPDTPPSARGCLFALGVGVGILGVAALALLPAVEAARRATRQSTFT